MTQSTSLTVFKMFLIAAFLLSACGGRQLEVEPISKSEHPQELINSLEKDIARARNDRINVLAPTWFAKAESSLKEAKRLLDEGAQLAKIFDAVATGRAEIRRAKEIAVVSHATLGDVIQGRDLARKAGAAGLGKDYAETEEKFLKLTRAIEKDNLGYAQRNRAAVTEQFRRLEIKAIKIKTVSEVRNLLRLAQKQQSDKFAPQSYRAAKNKLTETDAFITENPYKKEHMHKLANEALFLSRRHLEIASETKKIQTMGSEQIALRLESILHQAAQKLAAPDMRDQPLDRQVDNILTSISTLRADQEFTAEKVKEQQTKIDELEQRLASMEGRSRQQQKRLIAQKRLNQLFAEVQGFFDSNEAEVYKRENLLIIRLKSMHFPVGQAIIMPENYARLSKIQRAIRAFGEPDVIIGGHTDSTGPEPLNEHLSQQRAEAVRQYLVANGTLPFDKIIAVGYGSMRPLASNSTEKGRAMNRRIDITISPGKKAAQ